MGACRARPARPEARQLHDTASVLGRPMRSSTEAFGCHGPTEGGPAGQLVPSAATQFGLPHAGAPDVEAVGDVVGNDILVLHLGAQYRHPAPVAGVALPQPP